MHLTRRSALTSAALLVATACTSTRRQDPPAVDPDVALRDAAVARETALLALYADAIAGSPTLAMRLAPLRADHEAHLAALGGAPAAAPSASPAVTPTTPGVLVQLKAAEQTAARDHAAATAGASRELAAVLASLAACEASHAVVL